MTLCRAQGISLQQEGGVAHFFEADRDPVEEREDIWGLSGNFYLSPRCPVNKCVCVPKKSSFPISSKYIDIVRQKPIKTISESSIGFTIFRILNMRPHQGYSWVDGRLDQNKSHIETRNNLARSVVIHVQMCSKERKAEMGHCKKNKIQAARQKSKIHDILPDGVEEFNTTIQNARKPLEIQVEPAMSRVKRKRIVTRQDTDAESCSVKSGRRETLGIERRVTLFDKAFDSQACILHQGRNHSHAAHVADRGFHSWHHHYNLVYTLVPVSKAMKFMQHKMHWTKSATSYNNYQRGIRQKFEENKKNRIQSQE